MPEIVDEDLAGLAADGQLRSEYDLGPTSWAEARRLCGAMPRVSHRYFPPHPSFPALARDAHWAPWDAERPFRVFLDPAVCADPSNLERLQWLLWLAQERPAVLTVLGLTGWSPDKATHLNLIEIRDGRPFDPMRSFAEDALEIVVRGESAEEERCVAIETAPLERAKRRMERRDLDRRVVFSALALEVHKALDFDLFVVAEDSRHLRGRWHIPEPYGFASLAEAEDIVGTLLRARGSVPLRAWFGHLSVRFDDLAGALAASVMSNTRAALASCLSPRHVGDNRPIADLLEAILTRQSDLIRATQYLDEMNYLEAYYGGHHSLFVHQRYHLQNALVLASGTADLVAHVMALRANFIPSRANDISWTRLMDRSSTLSVALRAAQSPFVAVARNHDQRFALNLAYLLRDVYQHRHSLRGGVVTITGQEGWRMFGKACLCISQNITPDEWTSRGLDRVGPVPGIFQAGRELYLFPHSYVRGLTRATASLVEAVIGEETWPDSDWVNPSMEIEAALYERTFRAWP